MRELDEALSKAWLDAADDLGIRVIAPFEVSTESGAKVRYEAFIPDFGGPCGIVIGVFDDPMPDPVCSAAGYSHANLGGPARQYSRDLFKAFLNGWKWFGDVQLKPQWYTGEDWQFIDENAVRID